MSPKIFTLIAAASMGLLVSAAACTVESVDDDGNGGSGATGGTGTGAQGGAGVGGMGTGGDATGGTGTGGTIDCGTCDEVVYPAAEPPVACGTNSDQTCEAGSSCEKLVDLYVCACGDGSAAGACETECGLDNGGFCDLFVPPTADCDTCMAASCQGELGACTGDTGG